MRWYSLTSLILGVTLMFGMFLATALVPHNHPDSDGNRTVLFTRNSPCATCYTADNPTGEWRP